MVIISNRSNCVKGSQSRSVPHRHGFLFVSLFIFGGALLRINDFDNLAENEVELILDVVSEMPVKDPVFSGDRACPQLDWGSGMTIRKI